MNVPSVDFHAKLVIEGGIDDGVEFEVRRVPVRIGRDSRCDIVLRDDRQRISAAHAEIHIDDGRPVLVDLSRNGTAVKRGLLGGQQVVPYGTRFPLEDGDAIMLTPDVRLRYTVLAAPRGASVPGTPVPEGPRPGSSVAAMQKTVAAEKGAATRRRLLMLGVAVFWGWIVYALSTMEEAQKPDPVAQQLIREVISRPNAPGPAALTAKVGQMNFDAMRGLLIDADMSIKRGRSDIAASLWAQVAVWCRQRPERQRGDEIDKIWIECDRRRKEVKR